MLFIRGNQMDRMSANYTFDLSYYGVFVGSESTRQGLVLDKSNADFRSLLEEPLVAVSGSLFAVY